MKELPKNEDRTDLSANENSAFLSVFCTETAVFFEKEDGDFCLTHQGVLGWRLQGKPKSSTAFSDIGASQSLKYYMGETVSETPLPLTVQRSEDAITVLATDGTMATLSLSLGKLSFGNAENAERLVLEEMTLAGGTVCVCGSLIPGEGIFGGGERFDAINKRGSEIELYSSDGWNKSNTTYLVIPLFLSTRGAAIFFNHFEPALADFGAAREDAWSYRMESASLDCYLYATGDLGAALFGYTELSGHAYLPEEWMHGVQICRSGYDMAKFDQDFSYDRIEDIPDWESLYCERGEGYVLLPEATEEEKAACTRIYASRNGKMEVSHLVNDLGRFYRRGHTGNPMGDSVKTIMQHFIDADMKPEAAIMEGIGWGGAYYAGEDAKRHKEDIRRAVEWLHENGMKAMVYVRVGGVNFRTEGCLEEYKVHADVEYRSPDGSVERIENTTWIPWMMGTANNPDVGKKSDGSRMTDDYLDITNEEALEWYFDRIWGDSIEMGIDGVKIDFCEVMPDGGKQYANTRTDYRWKDPSRILPGVEHHSYPSYFISRFYKRMCELKKEKQLPDGFMVLSRGGGIGSQRSPYLWAGDQVRTFEKMDDLLFAVVNSGLSGVPFMTYDMAGYHYNGRFGYSVEGRKEEESQVFARAVQFTAFTSNIQTHGDVRHVYEMTETTQNIYRLYTKLHRKLIPYIHRYARIACETGMPIVRHPVLSYTADPEVYGLQDEFLLGEGLLVCPILAENTFEREVYLPNGNWKSLLTGACYMGGTTVRVEANAMQIPLFLNMDSPDAALLAPIFEEEEWQTVRNADKFDFI